MIPKKPMSKREIEKQLKDILIKNIELSSKSSQLEEQGNSLVSKTDELVVDNASIKNNAVIQNFQSISDIDIMGLTAEEREILIFKVLKALVWSQYGS